MQLEKPGVSLLLIMHALLPFSFSARWSKVQKEGGLSLRPHTPTPSSGNACSGLFSGGSGCPVDTGESSRMDSRLPPRRRGDLHK